jgi:tRNA dimethylallyltransferase
MTMIKQAVEKSVHPKHLVVITGPTAIGKTAVAIRIAKHFNTAILSADSRQFFKELKIGTAAPSSEELSMVKHYFIGHLSLDHYYNVSMFERDALALLSKLFQFNDVVVMTGGSGLYIDAVCEGIDDMPDIEISVRDWINEKFETEGIDFLHNRLAEADPEYFAVVDKNNPNRMKRALEVCVSTGKTFTSFRKMNLKPRNFNTIKIGLNISRQLLHKKIEQRVDAMIASGLLDEVIRLVPFRSLNALNTVGYKEIFDFLDEKITLEQAIEKIKTNTRRYARRQLTWLNRYDDITWFSPNDIDDMIRLIEEKMDFEV